MILDDEFLGMMMLVGWVGGWVRVRMEDQKRERKNRIGSAFTSMRSTHREEQQFVASVAVTTLRVALVLLLVDPLDDVLMVILPRFSLHALLCQGQGGF